MYPAQETYCLNSKKSKKVTLSHSRLTRRMVCELKNTANPSISYGGIRKAMEHGVGFYCKAKTAKPG
jgi:hypothetical protein